MPSKNIAHEAKRSDHQTPHHTRALFIVAAILFVIGLVAALAAIQSRNSSVASSASVEADSYTNALALDYAQPYLEADTGVTIEFSDALAMQYAQPYLEAEADAAGMTTTFSDAMALQYALPWLNYQSADETMIPYSDALALEYARPYLDAQKDAAAPFSNDLAMEDDTLWLRIKQFVIFNGRFVNMNVRPLK